jgi:DNA-binding CsgD family transcriptional regulator/tetratricopeptide (TPR) repeat protein
VGREGELEVLEEDSGAVVIAGDAGVGKSRLVAELERRAMADDKFVLVGECLELTDGELPYAAVVSALRPVLHHELAADLFTAGERQQLSRLWPELGGEAGVAAEADPSNQARVFGLLLRLLTALARQRPVVFIVEDLHWADRSTRDFLAFLVRAARGERILAVATLRLDELPREHPVRVFTAELTRVRGVRRLELAPFTADELAEQVEGILGERPRADLVARLFERSEGNAFYTEELLAAGGDGELPVSLRDLLLVRIERLSEPARQLLALVATAGRPVDERLLAAVGSVPDAAFAPALREALGQQVLVVRGDGGAYAFRHALVSEAVYRDLLAGERTTLHLALARTLAEHPELGASAIGVSGELAHHWYSAGDLVRALETSVQAAVDSDRAFAFAETLRHCERALSIWYRVPDAVAVAGIDRVALLERTALAAIRAEQPQRGAVLAAEAVAELDADGDPLRLAQVYVTLGRCRWLSADTEGSLEAYAEAVRLVPEQPPSPERALVLATEAQALMLTGQSPASLQRCAQALELAERLGELHVQAHVHNTLAGLGWMAGDAVEHAATARRLSSELGAVEEIGRSYVNGSEGYEYLGRTEDAIRLAQEGIDISSHWGITDFAVYLSASVATWKLRLGDPDAAARLWADADPSGSTVAAAWYQVAGLLSTLRGQFEQADRELGRAAELALGVGGPEWWPATTAAIAVLRLWQGRRDDAAHAAHAALDAVADPGFAPWLVDFSIVYPTAARVDADRAEDARARGDHDAALEAAAAATGAVARCDEMLAQIPEGRVAPRGLACRSLACAEAARAAGRAEPDAWIAAAQRFRELGEDYVVAYAEFRQAEACVAAGSRGGAAAEVPLRDAHALTLGMGEVPLRAQIEALARRARISLGEDGAAPVDGELPLGITAREREVLVLLAEGATNREIAETLVITEKTASVHVSHILAKLGARNRGEAAAIAHRLGLTA